MSANVVFPECFLETRECSEVEDLFAKVGRRGMKPESSETENETQHNASDTNNVSNNCCNWTQYVSADVKLLWNISVRVDIPAFEDYERMCLFNNHWSTTIEDLELLRRNLKRGVRHSGTEFLTFGGHWCPKKNKCELEDCFFGEGHKYVEL